MVSATAARGVLRAARPRTNRRWRVRGGGERRARWGCGGGTRAEALGGRSPRAHLLRQSFGLLRLRLQRGVVLGRERGGVAPERARAPRRRGRGARARRRPTRGAPAEGRGDGPERAPQERARRAERGRRVHGATEAARRSGSRGIEPRRAFAIEAVADVREPNGATTKSKVKGDERAARAIRG